MLSGGPEGSRTPVLNHFPSPSPNSLQIHQERTVECQTVGVEPSYANSLCYLTPAAADAILGGHNTQSGSNPTQYVFDVPVMLFIIRKDRAFVNW